MQIEVRPGAFSSACVAHNCGNGGYEYGHHQPTAPHGWTPGGLGLCPSASTAFDHLLQLQNALLSHAYRDVRSPFAEYKPDASGQHLQGLRTISQAIRSREFSYPSNQEHLLSWNMAPVSCALIACALP